MGELVRKQMAACGGVRRIRSCAEHDVTTCGIGTSPDSTCAGGGAAIGVDADLAEVVAEARLKIGELLVRHRCAAALGCVDCCGCIQIYGRAHRPRRCAADGGPLQGCR